MRQALSMHVLGLEGIGLQHTGRDTKCLERKDVLRWLAGQQSIPPPFPVYKTHIGVASI